jgi:hypothetical protein
VYQYHFGGRQEISNLRVVSSGIAKKIVILGTSERARKPFFFHKKTKVYLLTLAWQPTPYQEKKEGGHSSQL